MDGAIEAGERAAYEVAVALCDDVSKLSVSGEATPSRAVPVPPEVPGPEPANKKVT